MLLRRAPGTLTISYPWPGFVQISNGGGGYLLPIDIVHDVIAPNLPRDWRARRYGLGYPHGSPSPDRSG